MNSAAHTNAVAQLRDKDARALYPVLAGSAALALAVVAVFTIEPLRARFVDSTTGLVLLGLLLASQFISAAFATSKLQELIWWREFTDNTIAYLRTLPIPKHRLWITKVQLTALAGMVVLALIAVSAIYGIPFIVNVSGTGPDLWGAAWMMHVLESPVFSVTAPFFICGFLAMALLSFVYTCAPVGARRWRQREPARLWITGRSISARRVNAWIVIAIGMLTLAFSFAGWPIVIPASLLTASLIAWYLSSYLAFSGANLSVLELKRWSAIAAAATLAAAVVNVALAVQLSGAQAVAFRMMGYALARPLATERYTERMLGQMSGPQRGNTTMIETNLAAHLLDRRTIVALQPRLITLLGGDPQCAQRVLAFALLAVDAPRDNARAGLLLDTAGAPRSVSPDLDCAIPSAEFATLLLHLTDDATTLDAALRMLSAPNAYVRLIGAELAARIPAVASGKSRELEQRVLQSLTTICASRPDPDLRANYVRAHVHALSQLTLHQSLANDDDTRRALDTDCAHAVAEIAAVWTSTVTAQEQMNWDFKSAFARDFEFATGARFDFNLADITPASFAAWTRRDLPWEKLDAPMRCYLARQWNLAHRVPHLYAVRHLIKPPTRSFALGLSTGRYLFSEKDCAS